MRPSHCLLLSRQETKPSKLTLAEPDLSSYKRVEREINSLHRLALSDLFEEDTKPRKVLALGREPAVREIEARDAGRMLDKVGKHVAPFHPEPIPTQVERRKVDGVQRL